MTYFILIFSIFKLGLSFFIENKNIQNNKVDIKNFYKILKKDKNLKKIYLVEFLKGINRYGVMSLVVSLLIIYNTTETALCQYLFATFFIFLQEFRGFFRFFASGQAKKSPRNSDARKFMQGRRFFPRFCTGSSRPALPFFAQNSPTSPFSPPYFFTRDRPTSPRDPFPFST